jgi:hypothetical protein
MDPGNKAIESRYYELHKQAIDKGEAALLSDKYPKVEVNAYVASLWGSYARFKVTQEEAYFAAMRAGLRAHRYAEQVFEADPDYFDIYVGIGAFNVFTGSLPAVIKPFAWLIGARGDRDLGVQQLHTAMNKARYSQTEARIIYYTAMLEEKNWDEAWKTLENLRSRYRDNFVMYTWVCDWFLQQGRYAAGQDYFEKIFSEENKRSPLLAKYALLEKARIQKAQRQPDDAVRTLARLKAVAGGNELLSRKVAALEAALR